MEFRFPLASYIGAPLDHVGPFIGRVDENSFRGAPSRELCEALDALGKNSAIAQGLRKPVTFGTPHLLGQRIYLMADGYQALGFLKVGSKKLFVEPPPAAVARGRKEGTGVQDALREINPVCALDFYVHESLQRNGCGRQIFDVMLEQEGLHPAQLAYDRPSPKFIGFLRKHCGLTNFRPQNNNYVVFDDYFQLNEPSGGSHSLRGSGAKAIASGVRQSPFGVESGGILPLGDACRGIPGGRGQQLPPQQWPESTRPPPMPGTMSLVQDSQSRSGTMPGGGVALGRQQYPAETPVGAQSLQTPWGIEPGRGVPLQQSSRRPQLFDSVGARGTPTGSEAAAMPAAGARPQPRSTSVPSGSCYSRGGSSAASNSGSAAGERIGSSSSARRFASPLSHAGHVLMR